MTKAQEQFRSYVAERSETPTPSSGDLIPSNQQIWELEERIKNLQRWSSFLDGVVAGCFVAAIFSAVAILVMKGCK